jgi:hypothetical protein
MITTPYFDNIRYHILNSLKNGQQSILAAVCWFTNDELFNMLCHKLEHGISVELIILDDYINANPFGCNFQRFIDLGGHLYLSNVEKPMHNKYCIIDNRTLINGSYNWTYAAERNNEENVVIFDDCQDLIAAFNNDFNRLKSITPKVSSFNKKSLLVPGLAQNENVSLNTFGVFNMLSNDLFLKALETNNKVYYDAAMTITPDNTFFEKNAVELLWSKARILNSTLCESVQGDKIHIIFPKGTVIPAQANGRFTTVDDNQVAMKINILRGENEKASKNALLQTYRINGIPPLKAGEAKIETDYRISVEGVLYIVKYIHNTGLVDKKKLDLKRFFKLLDDSQL